MINLPKLVTDASFSIYFYKIGIKYMRKNFKYIDIGYYNVIFFTAIFNPFIKAGDFPDGESATLLSSSIRNSTKRETVIEHELDTSEREAYKYDDWLSNIPSESLKQHQILVEIVNNAHKSIWVTFINDHHRFFPKEIRSPYLLIQRNASALIPNNTRPLYVYIWLSKPKEFIVNHRVCKPDYTYQISCWKCKRVSLKWENKLVPNIISECNVATEDIEELKNSIPEDFWEMKKDPFFFNEIDMNEFEFFGKNIAEEFELLEIKNNPDYNNQES